MRAVIVSFAKNVDELHLDFFFIWIGNCLESCHRYYTQKLSWEENKFNYPPTKTLVKWDFRFFVCRRTSIAPSALIYIFAFPIILPKMYFFLQNSRRYLQINCGDSNIDFTQFIIVGLPDQKLTSLSKPLNHETL